MSARLSLEEGTATPAHWELRDEKPISLGRGLDNTIVLNDKCASKQHAEIFPSLGRWYVRDLGSRNGVTVNGRRVQAETELPPGARIVLGGVAPIPWRLPKVETMLAGQRITPELAAKAGEAALEGANPLAKNGYKIPLTKNVVRRTLLSSPR